MGERTTVSVWAAAGQTLEELRAAGHRFEVTEPIDSTERSHIRRLTFPNMTQAMAFAGQFDGGANADVRLARPVAELFDAPVTLEVRFWMVDRPAVAGWWTALATDPQVHGAPTGGQLDAYHALRAGQRRH